MKHIVSENLSIQDAPARDVVRAHALVVGEVLWDVFPDATRLGGAALNFAAHLERLGHVPRIVSAVGRDALGDSASAEIASLGLDTTFLQSGRPIQHRDRVGPAWARRPHLVCDRTAGRVRRGGDLRRCPRADRAVEAVVVLLRHAVRVPRARPTACCSGCSTRCRAPAVSMTSTCGPASSRANSSCDLLHLADVVKLNERELTLVRDWLGLPWTPKDSAAPAPRASAGGPCV